MVDFAAILFTFWVCAQEDPTLITDIREDIQEECGKFGTVKKILIFDVSYTPCKSSGSAFYKMALISSLFCFVQRHPEGIVSVAFKEFEAADSCVLQMNHRWYAGKQLQVGQWDGITNFQVEETDREREERLSKWENFLKEDGDGEKKEKTEQKAK